MGDACYDMEMAERRRPREEQHEENEEQSVMSTLGGPDVAHPAVVRGLELRCRS